jgi:hypothetical protein
MMFKQDYDEKNPFGCEISSSPNICSHFSSGKAGEKINVLSLG